MSTISQIHKRVCRSLPRPEAVFLLVGFASTVGAKLWLLRGEPPIGLLIMWIEVILADVIFFAAAALAIVLSYRYKPRPFVARCALLLSGFVLLWSLLNGIWLARTGIQLQPLVLNALIYNLLEFWPTVWTHLCQMFGGAVPLVLVACGILTWTCWRLAKPPRVLATRTRRNRRARWFAVLLAVAVVGQGVVLVARTSDMTYEALSFSSHWSGVVKTVLRVSEVWNPAERNRVPVYAGERKLVLPPRPPHGYPNVVLVLLESVSHRVTSLADPESGLTPNLLRFAAEGVELGPTRVPVSQTGKAYWAAFTGTTPDIERDYTEAVLADRPYESLMTILRRCGYRSAFFTMAKGTFEAGPATMANMGFDWAWHRENLQDPGAHLGYLGGDDFRLIEPAFAWIDKGAGPFLLVMITSIAHDPYDVPSWFGVPAEGRYEKYLQTVRFSDAFLGELLSQLRRCGLDENTILCVVGDHGHSFRGDDLLGRWVPYEEVIRVPWVIRWPGHVGPNQRADWPCSQLDVTPTILSLMGFDIAEAGFDGCDALQPGDPSRRCHFSSWLGNSPLGYIEGTRKWFYWPYIDKVFMFDLALDPGEQTPVSVYGAQAERVKTDVLRWQAESWIRFPDERYRERVLFDHWHTFSSGRSAWARFEP